MSWRTSGTTTTWNALLVTLAGSSLLYVSRRWWSIQTEEAATTAQDDHQEEAVVSILHQFQELQLDPETTVEEANKRRTASYYLKARQAHAKEVVRGVGSYAELCKLRQQHVDRSLRYSNMGTHSHRTVIVMCDASTAELLDEARRTILGPLKYSKDMHTDNVWIPALDMIPVEHMHVTVAIPWGWHTMREGNRELSQELAARFRQTLFLKFHHSFQIELQRIVLLGGQTLVALWRCVGERITQDGHVVYDRHGECVDPFVRLRVEIVRCFTTDIGDNRLKPLTYQDIIQKKALDQANGHPHGTTSSSTSVPPTPDRRGGGRGLLTREHSISKMTPGMGSGDGFIHTTLCRLPLDCLSRKDVSLNDVHRLCREVTAAMSGHRMVISKFRFLETTGIGGQSNPCVEPVYDDTIEAPSRFKVKLDGRVNEIANLHTLPREASGNLTIGATRNRVGDKPLEGLFDVIPKRVREESFDSTEKSSSEKSGAEGMASSLRATTSGEGTGADAGSSLRVEITAPILI